MTKEQRVEVAKRIAHMKKLVDDDTTGCVALQELMVQAHCQPSPADSLLAIFSKDNPHREVGARITLQLAMTCLAMLALDLMQEENCRNN